MRLPPAPEPCAPAFRRAGRAARGAQLALALLLAFALPLRTPASPPPSAAGAQAPLRVTLDDNYPPFIFKDADGALQGLLVDRWRAWERTTGRPVELHAMDWGDALARMAAGDFDVIDTIFRNPEREAIYEFSPPCFRIDVPIFFRREISGIVDLGSLKGFPVATKAGDYSVGMLRQAGVADVILYHNYEAIVEAARRGQVNVFVVDAPPAHYFLHKAGIHGEFRKTRPVHSGEFHRAVRKGDGALLAQVEAGFAAIPPEELARMDDKWFGRLVGDPPVTRYALHALAALALLAALLFLGERRRAARERERMRARLEESQKLEAVGRLAGGIAHDFNNMLCAILGNAELGLGETGEGDPRREYFEEIKRSAARSADLTRQLLAFARKQTVAPRVIDLNRAVEEALRMIRRIVGANVEVAFLPGAALPPVRIDPSQLDQALANLCANARDAFDGNGRIVIATSRRTLLPEETFGLSPALPGEYAELSVADNGRGMAAEVLSRAFEPFFTTKEIGQGTGLGLASVHGVVMQNGGLIDLASEPGAGTTVRILLPRHDPETPVAGAPGEGGGDPGQNTAEK